MIIIGFIFTGIAACIHLYIFFMQSIAWTSERSRAAFGITSPEQAQATKSLAFNQGFYNLFLALEVLSGIVLFIQGKEIVGATLIFVGAVSMVAAGLVLVISNPAKTRAALIQLVPPAIGALGLAIGVAS